MNKIKKFLLTYGAVDFICHSLSIICSCCLAFYHSIIILNPTLAILWGVCSILWIIITIGKVRETIKTLETDIE